MRKVKLKDITINITDGKHVDCKGQDNSGYYFISCKDVFDGCIHYENARQITEEDFIDADKRTKLAPNDILVTNSGTIGRMALVKDAPKTKRTTFQKSVAIVKPDSSRVFPHYLYYLLKSKVGDFINSSNGAAQKNLLLSTMRDFEMEIEENLEVQISIAEVLSRYDALIENYQRQIKLLEEAAQRLYKEWFVDLRFPGHQSTPIINNLPQSWQKKKLGEITCKFATGLNPRKNFVLGQGGNYYVTIKNMADNDVIFDDKCDKVDDEALEKINKRSDLQQGDLLFSGIGTIGRVYLIDEPVLNWNISESVFTMRPIKEISPVFLYLTLLNKDIQDYCQSNAHGCAQKGIRMADLKAYEAIIPDKETLESFVTIASKFIKRSKSLRKQIRNLSEARDRLLPKLMSAQIEV